ncbi:hypothetical protein RchiOBHm_Chr4g0435801 [Rosa chinensis]|uniref:Uncharacterized protein n=1 Tax=Rosa chinensis TaxID=74649 RepID=A0A2P6R1V3_ROSCH|nr:hypothetical protein RchiOBHm_Chr4g0435801 [Rosa chinensis]
MAQLSVGKSKSKIMANSTPEVMEVVWVIGAIRFTLDSDLSIRIMFSCSNFRFAVEMQTQRLIGQDPSL